VLHVTWNVRLVIPSNVVFGDRLGGEIVAGERNRGEHLVDQPHQGLNGKWLLEKGHVIGDHLVCLALMIRQSRHEDYAGCLLHLQGTLDNVVTMDPRIGILGGGQLKARRRQHEIDQQ
jgi:hypothetical protein